MKKENNPSDKKEKEWETEPLENDTKEEKKEKEQPAPSKEKAWLKKEGILAIDVYETEEEIVIQAPIAGIKKDDLEIITEKDMVIVKGKRERPEKREIKGFYTQECFFGNFRREVILPEETDPSRIQADIKEGILVIKAPKIEREKKRKIDI